MTNKVGHNNSPQNKEGNRTVKIRTAVHKMGHDVALNKKLNFNTATVIHPLRRD